MITVLRLGHRKGRDKRVTTHVGLVARAFGADELLISSKDEGIERTLRDVTARFGGKFRVKSGVKWRKIVENWEGTKVHLTMYGEHIDDVLPKIPNNKDLLIIVGAEKVPGEVFKAVDFNVALGNQPHSEVAALALFLDRFLEGEGLIKDFQGRMKIIPSKNGKKVVEIDD
ncbi:MAG: tRNA (cytidine(56)-2'-O)-methyltransferase [Candidatus Aminicenantes bacterium]|nr:MAG: tRNA (cytidine(56)-2'-O)-methyltransferase [Candidatus Aminicenantes bacterium]